MMRMFVGRELTDDERGRTPPRARLRRDRDLLPASDRVVARAPPRVPSPPRRRRVPHLPPRRTPRRTPRRSFATISPRPESPPTASPRSRPWSRRTRGGRASAFAAKTSRGIRARACSIPRTSWRTSWRGARWTNADDSSRAPTRATGVRSRRSRTRARGSRRTRTRKYLRPGVEDSAEWMPLDAAREDDPGEIVARNDRIHAARVPVWVAEEMRGSSRVDALVKSMAYWAAARRADPRRGVIRTRGDGYDARRTRPRGGKAARARER